MIHMHVPTYKTLSDFNDPFNKYNVFDIHINGAFHASVRYRLLFELHEKIVETFGLRLHVPEFPPKKMWRLDARALQTRRELLGKYLQSIVQIPDIARHSMIERAFLDFQIKSFGSSVKHMGLSKLEIFFPEGRAVVIDCNVGDSTNIIMERFCNSIGISEKNSQFFGLFLARSREDPHKRVASEIFDQICVRWLKNFEAPYIAQKLANRAFNSGEDDFQSSDGGSQPNTAFYYRILVHRVTWDPSVEEPLLDNQGCLKILYLQAVNDIQKRLLQLPQQLEERLTALQTGKDYKQFMRLCYQQASYGYEYLAPVVSDFPRPGTQCALKVGRRQIVLEHQEDGGRDQSSSQQQSLAATVLRSTRIKVWRVSHVDSQPLSQMTFELEYLSGLQFTRITLQTSQAVLLSLFLQSIAAEILHDQPPSPNSTGHYNTLFNDDVSARATESLEKMKKAATNSYSTGCESDEFFSVAKKLEPNLTNGSHAKIFANGPFSSSSAATTLLFNQQTSSSLLFTVISYQMPFNADERFDDLTDGDL